MLCCLPWKLLDVVERLSKVQRVRVRWPLGLLATAKGLNGIESVHCDRMFLDEVEEESGLGSEPESEMLMR